MAEAIGIIPMLSCIQPEANEVAAGARISLFRPWPDWRYRGPVLIHASARRRPGAGAGPWSALVGAAWLTEAERRTDGLDLRFADSLWLPPWRCRGQRRVGACCLLELPEQQRALYLAWAGEQYRRHRPPDMPAPNPFSEPQWRRFFQSVNSVQESQSCPA